ncbi:hypothetical protein C817_00532 [Dorea sp. 5-2]|nr:hypothetical protein C817_00532 [Dorea sp. 5-2]
MSITGISCIFPVPNIKKTEKFYVSCPGFRAVEYLECKEPHICLYKDEIEILLLQANTNLISPNREQYGYGYDAYLYTNDGETLESEFSSKGVKIIKSLNLTDYQNQEFVIEDCDGRWIAFGLKIKI